MLISEFCHTCKHKMSAKWHRFEVESFSYECLQNWYLSVDRSKMVKHDVLVFVVNHEGIEIVYFSVWQPLSFPTVHRELGTTMCLSRAVTDCYKDVFAYFKDAFVHLAKTYNCYFHLNVAPTDRGLWKMYPNIDQRPRSYSCLMNHRLAIVNCIPILHASQVERLYFQRRGNQCMRGEEVGTICCNNWHTSRGRSATTISFGHFVSRVMYAIWY